MIDVAKPLCCSVRGQLFEIFDISVTMDRIGLKPCNFLGMQCPNFKH